MRMLLDVIGLGSTSQMPLGIGFMGNFWKACKVLVADNLSQMPLGIGFMGNEHLELPN